MTRTLISTSEVVQALGGTAAVARMCRRKMNVVSMWKARDRFPPETYLELQAELERIHCSAPPMLWGIAPAKVNKPYKRAN